MKGSSLLTQVYRLNHRRSPLKSKSGAHSCTNRKGTGGVRQEAQNFTQLPVAIPKSQKDFWDGLAEQKRREAGVTDDIEVISSQ